MNILANIRAHSTGFYVRFWFKLFGDGSRRLVTKRYGDRIATVGVAGKTYHNTTKTNLKFDGLFSGIVGFRFTEQFSLSRSPCKCKHLSTSSPGRCEIKLSDQTPIERCWSCGKSLDATSRTSINSDSHSSHPADRFYCPHKECGVLQSPSDRNYFEQFGLPTDYDIDVANLTKLYKKIQQRLHPDKSTGLSQRERTLADAQSTLINKAYSALLKPVPRALYLLKLNGLSLEENDITVDPAFLLDILEINEEIADTEDENRLREIFDSNRMKMNNLMAKISAAFNNQDYNGAKLLIAEIKYLVNVEDKIKERTYFH